MIKKNREVMTVAEEKKPTKEKKKDTNIMKKIFVDNIGYKLLAFGVAAVLFVIVVGLGLKEIL